LWSKAKGFQTITPIMAVIGGKSLVRTRYVAEISLQGRRRYGDDTCKTLILQPSSWRQKDLIRLRVSPEATLKPVHHERRSRQLNSSVEQTADVAADVRDGRLFRLIAHKR
jgi:hypothetical protein